MKNFRIEIKWSLIFTAFGLLWMMMEKALGWHDELIDKHPLYTNLIAFPAIAMYVLYMLERRRKIFAGFMTWRQGFSGGLILSVMIAVLAPLSQYITSAWITPDYFTNAINFAVETETMTLEEAQNYFNMKSYMMQAPLAALIMGAITSAIVAAFVRKTP